jgi:hypothetical protein
VCRSPPLCTFSIEGNDRRLYGPSGPYSETSQTTFCRCPTGEVRKAASIPLDGQGVLDRHFAGSGDDDPGDLVTHNWDE